MNFFAQTETGVKARNGCGWNGKKGRDYGGNAWSGDFHDARDGAVGGQLLKRLKNGFPFLLGKVKDVSAFGRVECIRRWYWPIVDYFNSIDPSFIRHARQKL